MGDRRFFSAWDEAAGRNLIQAALSLAEFFHCSPFEFVDRDETEIMNLHRETLVMIRQRKAG